MASVRADRRAGCPRMEITATVLRRASRRRGFGAIGPRLRGDLRGEGGEADGTTNRRFGRLRGGRSGRWTQDLLGSGTEFHPLGRRSRGTCGDAHREADRIAFGRHEDDLLVQREFRGEFRGDGIPSRLGNRFEPKRHRDARRHGPRSANRGASEDDEAERRRDPCERNHREEGGPEREGRREEVCRNRCEVEEAGSANAGRRGPGGCGSSRRRPPRGTADRRTGLRDLAGPRWRRAEQLARSGTGDPRRRRRVIENAAPSAAGSDPRQPNAVREPDETRSGSTRHAARLRQTHSAGPIRNQRSQIEVART